MNEFNGFGAQTVRFLEGLGANNAKTWFDAHRADYEAHYLEPAKDFVAALAAPLTEIAPGVNAEPRVNGSIFRINRDIRFSKDKTPYKDHLDLWFWEGERKGAVSGLFFRLTKDALILGAGAHGFDPKRLAAYRGRIVDDSARAALARIAGDLGRDGLELSGEHYKKLPRGFEAADDHAERFLRHNALWCSTETAHPASLGSAQFVDHCIDGWRPMVALHRWLIDNLQ